MFTSTMQNLPLSQNFYFLWFFPEFPCVTIFLLVLHYDSGKQIARDGWSWLGTAWSGTDPTGFDLYPISIPPGVIVQKCHTPQRNSSQLYFQPFYFPPHHVKRSKLQHKELNSQRHQPTKMVSTGNRSFDHFEYQKASNFQALFNRK